MRLKKIIHKNETHKHDQNVWGFINKNGSQKCFTKMGLTKNIHKNETHKKNQQNEIQKN